MTAVPVALDVPATVRAGGADTQALREAVVATAPESTTFLDWPRLVEHLLAVGRTDAAWAKLAEAHVDALRIHAEAGTQPVPGACYAVWASRSHETGLRAVRDGDAWRLSGTLAFASGAGVVDRALIPVWSAPERHDLLDVDVRDWPFDRNRWRTHVMRDSHTAWVTLAEETISARPVGGASFYLGRPGFFPGGVGVAAAWAGGAARVCDLLEEVVPLERRSAGQLVRLGAIRADVASAVAVCRDYARTAPQTHPDPRLPATLARHAVAAAVRRVLVDARAAAGAAGQVGQPQLMRAIEDLTLYVAQQDPDQDGSWLGSR
ncbi:hypothetical protein [Nocardioides mangrovicus]|uniref:hypothetical protein n=1 Tax=Nocardioides mangrovicus TaxID=2478913 RepID=UPI0011C42B78|nr:hypothetical protein [Nocardioides mangrovicus]